MKLELRTDIQAYYDLANCCNDNINFIAFLIYLLKYKPTLKVKKDLEDLKISKYENDFNFLLDNLTTGTIKNLQSIYELTQGVADEEINKITI
jgi:hypothetical protein